MRPACSGGSGVRGRPAERAGPVPNEGRAGGAAGAAKPRTVRADLAGTGSPLEALAERFGGDAWLLILGTLDAVQGRKDEAQDLLNEALALSLAAHSTGSVTLCLVAFARFAVLEGDAERAALLAGAAAGLRRRVGLRAWPMLRHEEDDLVAQIRRALGAGRFDQVYAADARLSQRDAVTAVRDRSGPGPGHAAAPSRPGTSSRS